MADLPDIYVQALVDILNNAKNLVRKDNEFFIHGGVSTFKSDALAQVLDKHNQQGEKQNGTTTT